MSAGAMGVTFYLVQRLHDSPLLWLLALPVATVLLLELPFLRLLRRRLRHAGLREVLRQSVRLWGPPVLLIGCGLGLAVYPCSDRTTTDSSGELNGPDTRCERPEQSDVLLPMACPGTGARGPAPEVQVFEASK
ncbi:hypothetical protein [Yokenella regensburgei]|uniref:Uncharacterized protein n=2 Tax=Yokenella regensburgei TaxID=158877 RepID=A0AB38FVS7_9ENTR|nr:hypothetical protein [Yokenella regensburgei]KFD24790.1 hypothetical protein GYRE_00759 [Yokenella regensburgei ATCC 49455]SQA62994.1 Uncharacterised protein [Yokenella regensburgei]SQB02238.1 Uncharacterised protein [Yokenella regensburgei]SUQ07462.1 Uncharacterised protein [Yokenella regensburgei]